jgi:hypothetical protein
VRQRRAGDGDHRDDLGGQLLRTRLAFDHAKSATQAVMLAVVRKASRKKVRQNRPLLNHPD